MANDIFSLSKEDKKVMGKNPFMGFNLYGDNPSSSDKKKKRVVLTSKERLYVWEHPKKYGRTCHICGDRITKMSELELDHIIPFSKGGTTMNLAHRDCNRMKGSKNLKHIQTKMGFKESERPKKARSVSVKTQKPKKSKEPKYEFGFNPDFFKKETSFRGF